MQADKKLNCSTIALVVPSLLQKFNLFLVTTKFHFPILKTTCDGFIRTYQMCDSTYLNIPELKSEEINDLWPSSVRRPNELSPVDRLPYSHCQIREEKTLYTTSPGCISIRRP